MEGEILNDRIVFSGLRFKRNNQNAILHRSEFIVLKESKRFFSTIRLPRGPSRNTLNKSICYVQTDGSVRPTGNVFHAIQQFISRCRSIIRVRSGSI